MPAGGTLTPMSVLGPLLGVVLLLMSLAWAYLAIADGLPGRDRR